ncbi:hypothetical protein HYU13_01540 [Candidatus Woesearchaeota archaeon]|nr:hypothetical protein [Candidatus Woesearchaeota archaeon]
MIKRINYLLHEDCSLDNGSDEGRLELIAKTQPRDVGDGIEREDRADRIAFPQTSYYQASFFFRCRGCKQICIADVEAHHAPAEAGEIPPKLIKKYDGPLTISQLRRLVPKYKGIFSKGKEQRGISQIKGQTAS